MPRIRIDSTPAASLAYCECGWRELALTREGARREATKHEHQVHPGQAQARDTIRKAVARAKMSRGEVEDTDHEPG